MLWLGQLQDLGCTVKMLNGVKRGGELVSIIAPFAYCANPYLQQMAINMIKVVSGEYKICFVITYTINVPIKIFLGY